MQIPRMNVSFGSCSACTSYGHYSVGLLSVDRMGIMPCECNAFLYIIAIVILYKVQFVWNECLNVCVLHNES